MHAGFSAYHTVRTKVGRWRALGMLIHVGMRTAWRKYRCDASRESMGRPRVVLTAEWTRSPSCDRRTIERFRVVIRPIRLPGTSAWGLPDSTPRCIFRLMAILADLIECFADKRENVGTEA